VTRREGPGAVPGPVSFLWNTRRISDGDRVLALVRSVEGKHLTVERYREG